MDDWDKFETERPHTEPFDGEETTSRQNVIQTEPKRRRE